MKIKVGTSYISQYKNNQELKGFWVFRIVAEVDSTYWLNDPAAPNLIYIKRRYYIGVKTCSDSVNVAFIQGAGGSLFWFTQDGLSMCGDFSLIRKSRSSRACLNMSRGVLDDPKEDNFWRGKLNEIEFKQSEKKAAEVEINGGELHFEVLRDGKPAIWNTQTKIPSYRYRYLCGLDDLQGIRDEYGIHWEYQITGHYLLKNDGTKLRAKDILAEE